MIDKEAINLVRVDESDKVRLPSEQVSNDKNPAILTLRNTVSLLLSRKRDSTGKDSKGKTKTSKLTSKLLSLKGILLTLGGLTALLLGEEEYSRMSESKGVDPTPPKEPTPDTDNSGTRKQEEIDKEIDDIAAELDTRAEKGPATSKTTAPASTPKQQSKETMLYKPSGPNESVDSAISRAAKDSGENVKFLRAIIHLESGGDPRARSTQYLGLGQVGKSAWSDVQSEYGSLPPLTGGANDPRYDPYLNALVTARLMTINRRRIYSAAKAAGYKDVNLGLLYAAHNLGSGTINKMLAEKDSKNWDAKTKMYVSNQASELTQGGIGNYLKNADASMRSHYSTANEGVGSQQASTAESLGVMSSQRPQQLAAFQRTEAPVQVAAAKMDAPSSTSSKVKAQPAQVASTDSGQQAQGSGKRKQVDSGQTARTEEPFRLPNGKMASV